MSRFLAYTQSPPGHLFPLLSTLVELRRRGHDVVVVSDARARGAVEGAGLRLREATPELEKDFHLPKTSDPAERDRRNAALFVQRGEPAAADLERAIAQERPDALVVDVIWGAMVAAEASGLPWAMIAHSPMLIPTLRPRPMGPGHPPPRGPLGRARERLLGALQARQGEKRLPMLNRLRTARGLPPLAHAWQAPLRAPLVLAYTAPPFEYPRGDWAPSVRFVGPGTWDAPAEPPAWLMEKDDRPLVLVSTSSLHLADEALVETALAALADEPVRVVATVPVAGLPARVPANARVERYVPHGAVLPRAACVVCHAGFGITAKALAAGVPVVAVPFGRDQFEVARRVEAAGAGVRLPAARLTADALRHAVRQAMACRPGAERVAAAFRATGGAAAAADAVEALTGGGAGEDGGMPARLEASVRALCDHAPRNHRNPRNLDAAAAWIGERLREAGAEVAEQEIPVEDRVYRNVVARLGPETAERIVVGAHYDTFGSTPGADDNASAVAGLIELASLLGPARLPLRVELVAYTLEEVPYFRTPYMGSDVHAASLRAQGVPVRAVVVLEMIGCFTDEPRSQRMPSRLLAPFFPSEGNFALVVGRWGRSKLARRVAEEMRAAAPLPVLSLAAPRWLPGAGSSDHRSYWARGYDAVMVTDTAHYRNPRYHTPRDLPETLDYRRMAMVVQGLHRAILALAR